MNVLRPTRVELASAVLQIRELDFVLYSIMFDVGSAVLAMLLRWKREQQALVLLTGEPSAEVLSVEMSWAEVPQTEQA